jgi:hypothetical protein
MSDGRPYLSLSLLGCTIRRHWREVKHLATNREALLDRVAVVAFCWAFKHLAKQYRGNRMPTTVNGDYADGEPVLYNVVPYFGSRNPDGFDEVEIYADVTATIRRAEYWLRNDPPPGAITLPINCDKCGFLRDFHDADWDDKTCICRCPTCGHRSREAVGFGEVFCRCPDPEEEAFFVREQGRR